MGSDGVLENELWHKLSASLVLFILIPGILAVLPALAQPAFTYVEPGFGPHAFQVLSAMFAGVFFIVRNRLRRFLLITHTIPNNEAHNKK